MTETPSINSYDVMITLGGTAPGCIQSIGDITFTAGVIDTTCHGASVRKKMADIIDLGSFPITIKYSNVGHEGFYSKMKSRQSQDAVITFPFTPTETLTFSVIVTGTTLSIANGDAVYVSATLTLDGETEPTWETLS